jgi:hypothetical protein
MTATFFLAAKPDPKDLSFARELLGPLPRGARACYIGAAHDDDASWTKRSASGVEKALELECATPRLTDPKLDVKKAREEIEQATFLFLGGGDTVALCDHARARGLDDAFVKAAKTAKVVYGISAGACAVSPYTIGYDDDGNGLIAPCLDMGFPLPLDVHDEEEDWPEMRALLELVEGKKGLPREGVVIPTGASLIVLPSGELRPRGRVGCEKRSLAKGGKWKIEKIPALA